MTSTTTGTDAWRGIAAEEAEQMTAGLAAVLRTRARRLLIRPAPAAARPGARHAAAHRDREPGRAGRPVAGRCGHRPRHPAAAARRPPRAAGPVGGRVRGRRAAPGGHHPGVHLRDGPDRRDLRHRAAAAAVRALPAAAGGLPRALHLGPGDLPAGLRHRLDLGPVQRRPGRPGVGGPLAGPGRDRHAAAGLAAGPGRAGRVRPAGRADHLVPARVRGRLPPHQGNDRAGHRALRGDFRRDPRGAGVPPRGP